MKKTRKNTEELKKKSKFLFLIILIAALISITGTYAWFSIQRDVEIVGFRVNVEIAENLEISLDGEHWTHSIQIMNMRQFYGTYKVQEGDPDIYQAKTEDQRNYVPIELLPVSTIGSVKDGNLVFATGEIKDKRLSNLRKCSEDDIKVGVGIKEKEGKNDNHPYLAFDMYLRNLSRLTQGGDPLQLNTGSVVTAAADNTGLEYSVRVGFVKYGETVSIHEGDDADKTIGEKIRAIKPTGEETVAIWEPNSKFHIPFVVANDDRINEKIEAVETRAIAVTADGTLPTSIEDITDPEETALQTIHTNKPVQPETAQDVIDKNYASTEILNLVQVDGETPMTLQPNTISKVRCYIWLEGQDPDCIDLSSTGQEVVATIRLIKPKAAVQEGGNSYAD